MLLANFHTIPESQCSRSNPSRCPFHHAEHLCPEKPHPTGNTTKKGALRSSLLPLPALPSAARSPGEEIINSPSQEATAQQSVTSRKEKMSSVPMGECNDPNYGLSDEAAPAPGEAEAQARLTELVGQRNVLLGSLREGELGFRLQL